MEGYVRLCIGKKSCNELGQFQVGILVISVHCTYKPHYTSTLQEHGPFSPLNRLIMLIWAKLSVMPIEQLFRATKC